MSSTEPCQKCKGRGWVCGGCGRPNFRPKSRSRRDFGKGCFCTKRSVPCPAHVEQVHRCDYCATQVSGLNGNVLLDRPNGSPSTACAACRESWAQWHSVAFEQWQATRVTAAESTSPPGPPPTPREPQR